MHLSNFLIAVLGLGARIASAIPADLELSITLATDDDPQPRTYCEKFKGETVKYNNCMRAGEAFCGFEGHEQRDCIAAHQISGPSRSNPYCERWNEAGDAATKDACNNDPNFCNRFQRNAKTECEQAFGRGQPTTPSQTDYCAMYEGSAGSDCAGLRTSFCYRFPKDSNSRNDCCDQQRFAPYEKNGCRAREDPAPSQPFAGAPKPWYCSFLPTSRGCQNSQSFIGSDSEMVNEYSQ